jgi:hypothetical protein
MSFTFRNVCRWYQLLCRPTVVARRRNWYGFLSADLTSQVCIPVTIPLHGRLRIMLPCSWKRHTVHQRRLILILPGRRLLKSPCLTKCGATILLDWTAALLNANILGGFALSGSQVLCQTLANSGELWTRRQQVNGESAQSVGVGSRSVGSSYVSSYPLLSMLHEQPIRCFTLLVYCTSRKL